MSLLIASVAGALVVSALCSLMEASLLSLRPGQAAGAFARRPQAGAIWQRLTADIDQPIAAILILNTAAYTIGASIAGAQFDELYGDRWIWVFSLVFTWLMLQFTEILPKTAGVRHNALVAVWIARPLDLLVRVVRPIQVVTQFINRPFGGVPSKDAAPTAYDEITGLTHVARLSGEISTEQERIIKRGMRLSSSKVRDVMRPRVDIDALDVNTPPEEVPGAVAMSGFSRVPVYEGDLDHIFGFVYIKDLLLDVHMRRPIELRRLLRPALMVPETLGIDRLLEMFRQEQTQMAVVLDEYGGTEGIVTVEDVLEELVGAIHDERRREDAQIVRRDETSWLASGSTGLADLLETIGRSDLQPMAPSNVSTVGGLLQSQIDRVAVVGDRAVWNGLSLEVTDVVGQRIERLLVRVASRDEPRR